MRSRSMETSSDVKSANWATCSSLTVAWAMPAGVGVQATGARNGLGWESDGLDQMLPAQVENAIGAAEKEGIRR